jgi:hypothetical protein
VTSFDFPDWRREMEKAIERAEPIPIRVLLDQAERAFEDALAIAEEMEGAFDNADPSWAAPSAGGAT